MTKKKAGHRFCVQLIIWNFIDKAYNNIYYIREMIFSMEQISVNLRMIMEQKEQAEAVCSDIGMSIAAASCVFARRAIGEDRIFFEVGGDIPNKRTRRVTENMRRKLSAAEGLTSWQEAMKRTSHRGARDPQRGADPHRGQDIQRLLLIREGIM